MLCEEKELKKILLMYTCISESRDYVTTLEVTLRIIYTPIYIYTQSCAHCFCHVRAAVISYSVFTYLYIFHLAGIAVTLTILKLFRLFFLLVLLPLSRAYTGVDFSFLSIFIVIYG